MNDDHKILQCTDDFIECPHCYNKSRMEIMATVQKGYREEDRSIGYMWQIYLCSNCWNVILYQECFDDEDAISYEYNVHGEQIAVQNIQKQYLYPASDYLRGVPKDIYELYEVAKRLIHIDHASALVKIRQVLEAVCNDKKANGKNLYSKLEDLVAKGVAPETISKISHGLRKAGNIGAHKDIDNTYPKYFDVFLVKELCEIMLEYIYEAPAKLNELEQRLNDL